MDEIVDELAKDSRVASAYDLWYQLRDEVLRTYKDDLPDRLPLSQQKEFKRIKNLVIEDAVRLGEYTEVFAPTDTQEPDQAVENAGPESEVEPQSTDDEAPHADSRSPMLKCMKAHWKRVVSGLLAVVMAAGILPTSAFAADSSGGSNPYAPTGNLS